MMKLALAHDYLIQMGGAERVVATMHRHHPRAPIFTSAVRRQTLLKDFDDADIRTTWLQSLPGIGDPRHFKKYLLLYPAAFRSFAPVQADCVWISTSTFAKYLRVAPGVRSICYMHNPTRFLWQADEYVPSEVTNPPLRALIALLSPWLRQGDRQAARRMGVLVANSKNVQERIRRCYGRESVVIHPPVRTESFSISREDDGAYLILSRLIGYKNIDLAVRAFNRSGKPLVIIGEGSHRAKLEALASPNVRILGRQSEETVRDALRRCRALIFPGHEDFGIVPVEAMACGKPVIALARGGAIETILPDETGTFFSESTEEALLEAVARSEATSWDAERIRQHAGQFSEEAFIEATDRLLNKRSSGDE